MQVIRLFGRTDLSSVIVNRQLGVVRGYLPGKALRQLYRGDASGRPVASTTIRCEGLDVVDGEHLLIADRPEQFAEKTVRLLTDRQLYQYISANGRQLVEARYDWDQIAGKLMGIYAEMVHEPNRWPSGGDHAC